MTRTLLGMHSGSYYNWLWHRRAVKHALLCHRCMRGHSCVEYVRGCPLRRVELEMLKEHYSTLTQSWDWDRGLLLTLANARLSWRKRGTARGAIGERDRRG